MQETFTRVSGYVEQTDVHNAYTTVQEALEFSAQLRIAGATKDVIAAFVDEIMDLVELTPLRDLVVRAAVVPLQCANRPFDAAGRQESTGCWDVIG